MIAFDEMLVGPAKEAGMKVPKDLRSDWKVEDFPHWNVFCTMQLGASMPSPGCHWENAKVIAAISQEEIFTVTPGQIYERGFAVGRSSP